MLNIKNCHYFNNGKVCPFESIGCMFNHIRSDKCLFLQKCINKLCPFRHPIEDESSINFGDNSTEQDKSAHRNVHSDQEEHLANNDNVNLTHDDEENLTCNIDNVDYSESEAEEEDLECELCGKVSDNFDAYIDHKGVECVDYCNYCDQHFKHEDKEGLRKHTEKHCVNCEKLFSTQKLVRVINSIFGWPNATL